MPSSDLTTSPTVRVPLRLTLADPERPTPLDGGWWPQSTNLSIEVADLVNDFPSEQARIVRARYSLPDWEDAPKRVTTARGYIETTSFARDYSPVVILATSDRRKLCLLVIPPSFTAEQGEAALQAAVTPGFASSPSELLATITRDSKA